MAPPFRQAEFQILYGQGINQLGEVLDLGVQQGLVDKSGAWYAYKGDKALFASQRMPLKM